MRHRKHPGYCIHPLPNIYNTETGEPLYWLGNVYVCPKCDIQWIVVTCEWEPGINMWQQPEVNTIHHYEEY